jgi:cation:H+ antiporter
MFILTFFVGLALLIIGAEILVKSASRISALLGISPLIIGLTVVAFGTSSPEMIVSVKASLSGNGEIAMGNVVGSNIFNILFILGLSALIRPLRVYIQLIRWDVPIMIILSLGFFILCLNGYLGRFIGLMFVLGLLIYILLQILLARKGEQNLTSSVMASPLESSKNRMYIWLINSILLLGGLFLLTVGSNFLISGAISIATVLGVSELVIGLTIVSAGTSLPEVATSILASIRGETDISVGNIIGSNIFNILGVTGLAAIFSPGGISISPELLQFDLPLMVLISLACLPILFTKSEISRWEGGLFFGYYLFYILFLILRAMEIPDIDLLRHFILLILLPGTILIIIASAIISNHKRKKKLK